MLPIKTLSSTGNNEMLIFLSNMIIANSDAVSFQFHRNTVGSLGPSLQLRARKTRSDSSISLSVLYFTENCFLTEILGCFNKFLEFCAYISVGSAASNQEVRNLVMSGQMLSLLSCKSHDLKSSGKFRIILGLFSIFCCRHLLKMMT